MDSWFNYVATGHSFQGAQGGRWWVLPQTPETLRSLHRHERIWAAATPVPSQLQRIRYLDSLKDGENVQERSSRSGVCDSKSSYKVNSGILFRACSDFKPTWLKQSLQTMQTARNQTQWKHSWHRLPPCSPSVWLRRWQTLRIRLHSSFQTQISSHHHDFTSLTSQLFTLRLKQLFD